MGGSLAPAKEKVIKIILNFRRSGQLPIFFWDFNKFLFRLTINLCITMFYTLILTFV